MARLGNGVEMDWSRVPLLLVVSALLIGGLTEKTSPSNSDAMLAVGWILLGAWTTIEIQSWYQRLRRAWEKNESLIFEQVRNEEKTVEDDKRGL